MTAARCRTCGVKLISPDNWRPSLSKLNSRICTPCRRAYEVARFDKNPTLRAKAKVASDKFHNENPGRARETLDAWLSKHPDYMKNWRAEKKRAQQGDKA
jgi:hypothetical protein